MGMLLMGKLGMGKLLKRKLDMELEPYTLEF